MDTKKLEALAMAVRMGSFTRAAETLGYTQSGLTHMMNSLEKDIGFALLVRSRTGIRLTAAGERVFPMIQELLRASETLEGEIRRINTRREETIRVAAYASIAMHWLPEIIQRFRDTHPEVTVDIQMGSVEEVYRWVREDRVDMCFASRQEGVSLEWTHLRDDPLLAVLPKGHPLAGGEVCRVEELAREPFISLLESSDHDARRALEQYGAKPNVKYSTKDDYAVMAMEGQGMGVSVMPSLLLRGHQENLVCLPLAPASSRTLALALPAGEKTGPAARRFAEFAAEWVRENG